MTTKIFKIEGLCLFFRLQWQLSLLLAGLYLVAPSTLYAGYLNENLRVGIDSYTFNYTISQLPPFISTNNNLSSFNMMMFEYDSKYNIYGEARFFLGDLQGTGSRAQFGAGYIISSHVALGMDLFIAHNYESVSVKESIHAKQSNMDLMLNPYCKIKFRIQTRLEIEMKPSLMVAYIRSSSVSPNGYATTRSHDQNRTYPLVLQSDAKSSENADGYLGFGMKMESTVQYELARNVFYRSSIGFGLLTGSSTNTKGKEEKTQSLTHFSFQANFAQLIYQF